MFAAEPAVSGAGLASAGDRELGERAASGDRAAVAELYARYGTLAYNAALRVGGAASAPEAVASAFALAPSGGVDPFRSRLLVLATARAARAESGAARHDAGVQLGGDRDPATGPEPWAGGARSGAASSGRSSASACLDSDVRAAHGRLARDERRALALRELGGLAHARMAAALDIDIGSVALLLAHGRLRLRDALRDSRLDERYEDHGACRRALPLLARRQDGELHDLAERAWLLGHLEGCDECSAASDAMHEASLAYRAWTLADPPGGVRELVGAGDGEDGGSTSRAPRTRSLRGVAALRWAAASLLGAAVVGVVVLTSTVVAGGGTTRPAAQRPVAPALHAVTPAPARHRPSPRPRHRPRGHRRHRHHRVTAQTRRPTGPVRGAALGRSRATPPTTMAPPPAATPVPPVTPRPSVRRAPAGRAPSPPPARRRGARP